MAENDGSGQGGHDAARYLLGVDTGGTYTDAVLIDEGRLAEGPAAVVAKAKALTTRGDLALGIGAALSAVTAADAVAGRPAVPPERIALVSLSTTLATNALVEGQGGRVCLVMIGFDEADLARAGLADALGGDPLIRLAGGHDGHGSERAPLDRQALARGLDGLEADGFALCGHFAVRNPAHELAARELIRAATGRPVTCSHELSPRMGGPKRALTALLNARLIGLIERLVSAAERLLAERGIAAPLMIVRGDGALVSAGFARLRPIETILSGPAASVVGASFLTGIADAVVSDIGGTTTDIAVVSGGRPRLDPAGATVGGWRTMVEAVAVQTHGLGGDSEVGVGDGGLTLGPRRLVPVSLMALEAPALVHGALDRQLARAVPADLDGRFLAAVPGAGRHGLGGEETALLAALDQGPAAADTVLRTRLARTALRRLVQRGLVTVAGFTPSDAAHALGRQADWDAAAARKAARLMARRRTAGGSAIAPSAEALAERVIATLIRRSAELVLDAAFAHDGWEETAPSATALARAALDGHRGLVRPRLDLTAPLIGLGAPAPAYYPAVARLLATTDATPAHADVANAIGAVVGHVRIERRLTITCPAEGRYRVHDETGPRDHASFAAARAEAETALARAVRAAAAQAGAAEVEVTLGLERREAEVEGRPMLMEARVTAAATGRPRLAELPEEAAALPPGFTGV